MAGLAIVEKREGYVQASKLGSGRRWVRQKPKRDPLELADRHILQHRCQMKSTGSGNLAEWRH